MSSEQVPISAYTIAAIMSDFISREVNNAKNAVSYQETTTH